MLAVVGNVGAGFAVDDDAFILSGAAQSTDLDTQLQLLTAYVVSLGGAVADNSVSPAPTEPVKP